jgi:RND family efflux transporter MFP subunit
VDAARQAVAQAEANLERLRNAATFAVQQAEATLRQAQATLELRRSGATAQEISMAEAAVEQAQAQVQQAQANLAATTLTAPFAGTVGAVIANLGEMVSPSSPAPVVTLIDTRQIRVDVAVDEVDVAKVQPGQEVQLTFDALPKLQVPGRVDVIGPAAVVQQGVVTYPVQIRVDPAQAPGVRPGMTATAAIVVAVKDNAVLVPNRALKTVGDSPAVEVLDSSGRIVIRTVQTGMANDEMTEILSGVSPGERVILPKTTLESSLPPAGTLAGTGGAGAGSAPAGVPSAAGAGTGPAGLGPPRSSR